MKIKKLLICIVTILGLIDIILFYYDNNHTIIENKVLYTLENLDTISMMIETELNSGIYDVSTDIDWPDMNKYEFNSEISSCENGGKLSWNYTTNTLELTNNISDKCYIYFDVIPPDVTVTTSNTNLAAYNASTPATLTCDDAVSSYNQKYQAIEISDITSRYVTCTLTYETPNNRIYLNDYIMSLGGTTSGDGEVVDENGYRFEGKNPNNYIWFNDELWRIIGVFGEETHGIDETNLVKIIRATELDGYAWNKLNTNDWSVSSLNNLLNSYYYYGLDGTDSGDCYGYLAKTCHYEEVGLNEVYRLMVENVTWYLGGYSSTSVTADNIYTYERSGNYVYSGRPTSMTGYIGLMYISDYGYSVLSNDCSRTTLMSSYNSNGCAGSGWLYGKGYEWLLTASSSSSNYIFYISTTGYINSNQASYSFTVRPVLYLSPSVYVVSGSGTESDPIIIGM